MSEELGQEDAGNNLSSFFLVDKKNIDVFEQPDEFLRMFKFGRAWIKHNFCAKSMGFFKEFEKFFHVALEGTNINPVGLDRVEVSGGKIIRFRGGAAETQSSPFAGFSVEQNHRTAGRGTNDAGVAAVDILLVKTLEHTFAGGVMSKVADKDSLVAATCEGDGGIRAATADAKESFVDVDVGADNHFAEN
jgi:hypothetical protein